MLSSNEQQKPGPEMSGPENFNIEYLTPKKVSPRYCRCYSTFMKRLNKILPKGGYKKGAFRLIPQEDTSKRVFNQWQIHPYLGIEFLDEYFDPKHARR